VIADCGLLNVDPRSVQQSTINIQQSPHRYSLSLELHADRSRQVPHRVAPVVTLHPVMETSSVVVNREAHFVRPSDPLHADLEKEISHTLTEPRRPLEPAHHLPALRGLQKYIPTV
jgi:hypothetical protein